ncbi:hypothetical protein V6N13_089614 [Hibiscus sabdariffa]
MEWTTLQHLDLRHVARGKQIRSLIQLAYKIERQAAGIEDEWNQMIVSQAQGIAQHVVVLAKEVAAPRPYIKPLGEVGLRLMWLIEEIKELGTQAEAYA